MGVVCFGAFMGQLDASIVTITFPAMERDFSVPVAAVQWVSLIYLLGLIAMLALAGRLGDAVGRKLVYTYGAGPASGYPEFSGRQSWICGSSRVPWGRAGAARVRRARRRRRDGCRDRAGRPATGARTVSRRVTARAGRPREADPSGADR
ncbi:MAG: MFS transporter [Streptosporangiaceae bacterium]